jgi:hypothetical protein
MQAHKPENQAKQRLRAHPTIKARPIYIWGAPLLAIAMGCAGATKTNTREASLEAAKRHLETIESIRLKPGQAFTAVQEDTLNLAIKEIEAYKSSGKTNSYPDLLLGAVQYLKARSDEMQGERCDYSQAIRTLEGAIKRAEKDKFVQRQEFQELRPYLVLAYAKIAQGDSTGALSALKAGRKFEIIAPDGSRYPDSNMRTMHAALTWKGVTTKTGSPLDEYETGLAHLFKGNLASAERVADKLIQGEITSDDGYRLKGFTWIWRAIDAKKHGDEPKAKQCLKSAYDTLTQMKEVDAMAAAGIAAAIGDLTEISTMREFLYSDLVPVAMKLPPHMRDLGVLLYDIGVKLLEGGYPDVGGTMKECGVYLQVQAERVSPNEKRFEVDPRLIVPKKQPRNDSAKTL